MTAPGDMITVDVGRGPVAITVERAPHGEDSYGCGWTARNDLVAFRAEDVVSAEPEPVAAVGAASLCTIPGCGCSQQDGPVVQPAPLGPVTRSDGTVLWPGMTLPIGQGVLIERLRRVEAQLAAAEGRALGWRMRALLAEAERAELAECAAVAGLCDAALTMGAREEGYASGHRDGLAVGQHQLALIADVLRAAERLDPEIEPEVYQRACEGLENAVRTWTRAGRPGLGEGER